MALAATAEQREYTRQWIRLLRRDHRNNYEGVMLYIIPIEPLEERYSAQWLAWTQLFMMGNNIEHHIINPQNHLYDSIEQGAFLDVVKTNEYKNAQMSIILTLFKLGQVKDGDVFWFHDMWFPGLEMLAYIRDGLGLKIKIYGCLHAGTYDPYDFLSKKKMTVWAKPLEQSWISLVDGIFVATHFHKKLIMEGDRLRGHSSEKIYVTGFPIYPDFISNQKKDHARARMIVFPHRLDDEKQPHIFDMLHGFMKERYEWASKWEFIKTKEECKTKEEYYKILRRAKFAVSFALQETWGIAMQEAVLCGCIPIVPDRLSYSEMYPHIFKNNGTVIEAAAQIDILKYDPHKHVPDALKDLQKKFTASGVNAFENMMLIMGLL